MRIFTLFFMALFASLTLNAQLFVVETPPTLAGIYDFGTKADDDTSVPWLPGSDMVDSIWCGNLIVLEDATAPINDGCEDAINDMTGMIAVIDRGACNFSSKVFRAQEAGATGAIIVNNQAEGEAQGGVLGMLGGDFADQVTIPAIFLSLEDGSPIRDAVLNGETVEVCMGAIVFNDNLSITFETTRVPRYGIVPANQIEAANPSTVMTPSSSVINSGLQDQTNAVVDVTIDFTPAGGSSSQEYTDMTNAVPLVMVDSTEATNVLSAFDYTGSVMGEYIITYTLESDSVDQAEFDNEVVNNFSVSENLLSRANWDSAANDIANSGQGIGCVDVSCEMLSGFRIPNGDGMQIDSVTFGLFSNDADETLDGISVSARLYKWTDLNADFLINTNDGELEAIGLGVADFAGFTETSTTTTITELISNDGGPILLEDDMNVLLGLRYERDADAPRNVFFFINSNYSHEEAFEAGVDTPNADYAEIDFPHLFADFGDTPVSLPEIETAQVFAGLPSVSAGIYINASPTDAAKEVLSDIDAKLELYPNPASELLTADVSLSDVSDMIYKVTDATGRLIFTTSVQNVKTDKAEFNVAQLPAGQYFLTIQTDKGIRTETFSVNR